MKIRPMDDRVIVKAEVPTTTSKGGIVLASLIDKETTVRGKIVAVGPGVRSKNGDVRPLDVQVGEVAVFVKTAGTEVTDGGEKYLVVREADILFVL
jgi:chaperonin GroES